MTKPNETEWKRARTTLPPSRCFVTGGTGFVGSHLVERLLRDRHEVHVLARPRADTSRLTALSRGPVIWQGDLHDPATVAAALRAARPQVIFHLASATETRRSLADLADVPLSIASNLSTTIDFVRQVAALPEPPSLFIRTGTLAEYGRGPAPSVEDQREQPSSSYAAAEVATTHFLQMMQSRLPFALLTLRLALVYGPRQQRDFFVPAVVRTCLANQPFTMSSPQDRRDLIYVDDVIEAICRAAIRADLSGHVVNIASGLAPTMWEVATIVRELIGTAAPLVVDARSRRAGDAAVLHCDTRKAFRLLNWRARVPLREGLSRTIAAMRREREPALLTGEVS